MNYVFTKLIIISFCLCLALHISAQDNSNYESKAEFGLDISSELQVTDKGKVNYANVLRLHADVPLSERMSFQAASLSTYMTSAESIGSELQTFSNLDAERIPFALSVCGINWEMDDRHSLFLGIRNMNEDYFASPVTTFFTNSSGGIYPTVSVNYPVANYPMASVGVHYKYATDDLTLQASVYNGTGYNRFAGRENIFRVCPGSDGVFVLTEAQYSNKGSQYFLGNALRSNGGTSSTPWIYAEQRVTEQLTMLAGASHAFGSEIDCSDFICIGAHYQFPKVELGLFTDYAHFSETEEWATELTCGYSLTKHVSLQPAAHLIVTGGDFSSAYSLRVNVEF